MFQCYINHVQSFKLLSFIKYTLYSIVYTLFACILQCYHIKHIEYIVKTCCYMLFTMKNNIYTLCIQIILHNYMLIKYIFCIFHLHILYMFSTIITCFIHIMFS